MTYSLTRVPAPLVLLFGAVAIVVSVWTLTEPSHLLDLLLDSVTTMMAVTGALIAGVRLAIGSRTIRGRLLWRCILLTFLLVALGTVLEPYTTRIEHKLNIDDLDHLFLLAVAPIALWFTAKLELIPSWARKCLVIAFLFQIGATVSDVYDETLAARLHAAPDLVESYSDLANFVSMQGYMLAALLTVAEVKLRDIRDGTSALVEARVWPPAMSLFAPARYNHTPIGRLRREAQRAFWQSAPWWKIPIMVLCAPAWPFAIAATSVRQLQRHGSRVKAESGRSYAAQVVDHFSVGLTSHLWPHQYYMFELYDPVRCRRAYEYLRRPETKGALYKLLRTSYDEPGRFRDKLLFFRACQRVGVRTVPVVLAVENGIVLHPAQGAPFSFPRSDLFIKPQSGRGGNGAEVVRYGAGYYMRADGRRMTEAELIDELTAMSLAASIIVQPRLENHSDLSEINMNALSTVRVVTGTGFDGRGKVLAAALRVASRKDSVIDNFHAGGIAAAIDLDSGSLGQATDLGLSPNSAWHSKHPITGGQIEGLQVPDWSEMVALAETAHTRLADRVILGWDMAPLPDGPCIIEANAHPDLDICQRTLRTPLGNEELGRLMAHHIGQRRRYS
ncbi:MAG: sugar-transfer associated ATP-grasp domain-containing protein [Dongiaceae bacterium]